MAINDFGKEKGLMPTTQLKTSLFMPNSSLSTWCFFADNRTGLEREWILRKLINWHMNSMISLLSNTDPECPVSFFDVWGGNPIWDKVAILDKYAKIFKQNNSFLIPCIFCDDGDNWKIQRAKPQEHERAIMFLLSVLRPYISAILIGLESSEYFNKEEHEYFIGLIKKYAPDIYVGTHLQKIPEGGKPKGLDFIAYEHSWNPNEGDKHSPEEVVEEVKRAQEEWGIYIFPVEYNTNTTGSKIVEQSQALLRAGFSCGGAFV